MIKENYYAETGILIPDILLPNNSIDKSKWAVVACDQFTSSKDYWNKVEENVGENPSTLRLTLPEIYLGSSDEEERIEKINKTMDSYLENGIFEKPQTGFMLIKRHLGNGKVRTGLLLALDLEKYDYTKGSKTLIRATEGTVLSRIPPRTKVRKNASIELPHVLMLINDKENEVFKRVFSSSKSKAYDFELMEGGGRIEGYLISDRKDINEINDKFQSLISNDLLYAVGDGNHSFAAAKTHWENLKKNGADEFHPARFCMCEIENIHDNGIDFEPIHRVLFDVDFDDFTDKISEYFGESCSVVETPKAQSKKQEAQSKKQKAKSDEEEAFHTIEIISKDRSATIYIDKNKGPLAVGIIQDFIDKILTDVKIDYIHDNDEVLKIVNDNENSIGILLPSPQKSGLFEVCEKGEVLPRKTFSMGDARTKRYYVEARRII